MKIEKESNNCPSILFLIFNRPETTARVFDAIRLARPARLYIAADGARKDRVGEEDVVNEVRQIVTQVDWPCEVFKLFRKSNLGCKMAITSAIDWFFETEEEGVILEDDCLPSANFFEYSSIMLQRYRNEEKIAFVTGTNYFGQNLHSNNYFYSTFASIWGWATWKRSWMNRCLEMDAWSPKEINDALGKFGIVSNIYLQLCYRLLTKTNIGQSTWDYQWTFAIIMNGQLAIVPSANLVSNIGVNGTHFKKGDKRTNLKYGELNKELLEPKVKNILEDLNYEKKLGRQLLLPLIVRGYFSYGVRRAKSIIRNTWKFK